MEAKKYLPVNYQPSEFGRPPTESLKIPLQKACLRLEEQINTLLLAKAEEGSTPPRLQVGTELEYLFFSDEFDPAIHSVNNKEENPNYSFKHELRVKLLAMNIAFHAGRWLLQDSSTSAVTCKTLFAEVRTKPGSVQNYFDGVERITELTRRQSQKKHILPIVHSQHIHVSLTDKNDKTNVVREEGDTIRRGLKDAYHRTFPLIMLPEEADVEINATCGSRFNGEESRRSSRNPYRIEGRLNSSEYAFDPYINLFVHLLGVYRGLAYSEHREDISADYPFTVRYNQEQVMYYGSMTDFTYQRSLQHLLVDPVLQQYLTSEVIEDLYNRVSHYSEISRGEKTVAQVREEPITNSSPQRRTRTFALFR